RCRRRKGFGDALITLAVIVGADVEVRMRFAAVPAEDFVRADIPLLAEEGWMRRAQRRRRRGGQVGATVAQAPLIKASPYRARASRPARQLLLSCRATPPLPGGEFVFFNVTRVLNSDDRGQQGHRACFRRRFGGVQSADTAVGKADL